MKTIKSICLCFFIVAVAAISAIGQPFRTDINPALLYYQASQLTPDLSPTDHSYLLVTNWRGQKLPERFGELVARYDNQFKLLRQAARATVPCDWGLDMSQGPDILLPHLARNKGMAQTARLRTMWHLQQGRPADARDDLLATFALARNSARDGILISALVQVAMENIICSVVAENFGQFPPEILKELADGFDAAPARGTMAGCIPTEKSLFLDWLGNKIVQLKKENPGNEAKVMAGIRELLAAMEGADESQPNQPPPNHWEQLNKTAGGTSDGVLRLLRNLEPFYDRLATMMTLPQPDYEAQAKPFNAEIESSPNPFVSLSLPAFDKCRQKEFVILVKLAMVRAAVEYKLKGEPGLKSVIDPCGQGPFSFERFIFEGVDRGFALKSAYSKRSFPEMLLFVEKDGPPFYIDGEKAGKAVSQ